MKFRDIIIDDYKKIVPFWKENYFVNDMDSFYNFKVFLEKNPNLSILAEDEGQIVGTALGSFDGRRGYLQKLVVDKTFRRKRLGYQLVELIIKKLRTVGATYIPIAVEEELFPFYVQYGFKKSSQTSMNINI